MTPLEEARAFLNEVTRGGHGAPRGNRGRGRGGNRGRGGTGGAPVTPPRAPATRGGRGGGGRGGSSLLQRAVSNAAFQPAPAPATQETNGRHPAPPLTPSFTPPPRNTRPFAIPIVAPPSDHNDLTPPASPAGGGTSMFAPQVPSNIAAPATGPRSHTPVTRASTFRGRGRGRGRGGRARFTTQEEEDAVRAFFEDDTPAQVGEICFYQEEYLKKNDEPSATSGSSVQPAAYPTLDPGSPTVHPTNNISGPKESPEVKAPGKSVPAASKSVNAKEREQQRRHELEEREQQRRREQKEREEQVRCLQEERKKQLVREHQEKQQEANREYAEKKKQLARERMEQERKLSHEHSERKKQLNLFHKIEKAQVPAYTQQDIGTDADSVPNAVSNPTEDDLMDMDFEPTVTQYVAPPSQPSPFGFNNSQYPATTAFPDTKKEEEEEEEEEL
ncbi:hypothetical protein B0T20DRAFT_483039 [Sordaria brevicollis]|uniref:Uncharacterized protein n=1 Tax=Sordaria brevicollis TaxID=83679 RepID=A0AAE0P1V8_SORBR|nr:hypothetical protein B0T20DRAFT_483039 [Sordaria brevicollis]